MYKLHPRYLRFYGGRILDLLPIVEILDKLYAKYLKKAKLSKGSDAKPRI